MASRNRRQQVLNFDGDQLEIWQVRPFNELFNALAVVRQIAVPTRPLGMVTGAAGVGKTFTANVYAHNNPDTVIVTTPPRDVLTPRMLLDEIAEALGVEPAAYRTKAGLFSALIDSLADRRPYLIVDEADRLRPSNADMLRELAEASGAPLCYLGCPSLEAVLAHVPATHHRVGFRHHVRTCEIDDVRDALRHTNMGPGRTLDEDTIQAVWDATRGNLRHIESLLHLLRGAKKRSTGELYDITPATVRFLNARFQKAA